jgi:hypothetical protein
MFFWGGYMDLFFEFILQAVGYFITTYFVFSIFGHRKKVGYILLFIIFMSTLTPFLRYGSSLETRALILLLVYDVGPVFFAALVFISITGGMPMIKLRKRRVVKGISTKIQTKQMNVLTSYLVIALALIAGATSYFIFEDVTMYLILGLSVISLILGVILYIKTLRIVKERVILFVGKQKENIYTYEIPVKARSVEITDFFTDDRYIIDRIGEVLITNTEGKDEKDYLYWLATSERVTIEKPLYPLNALSYHDDLNQFEKYHIKSVAYKELKSGKLEKVKEKIIK